MRMTKRKSRKKIFERAVILLVFAAILSVLYCLGQNLKNSSGEKVTPYLDGPITSAKKKVIINCAKKYDTNEKLLANYVKSDDCLFMGCGDFYQ
jgi:hypothetical protein